MLKIKNNFISILNVRIIYTCVQIFFFTNIIKMPLLEAKLKQNFKAPFLSDNDVYCGARLSTPVGTAFATTDDSYESIESTISFAFGSNLRPA